MSNEPTTPEADDDGQITAQVQLIGQPYGNGVDLRTIGLGLLPMILVELVADDDGDPVARVTISAIPPEILEMIAEPIAETLTGAATRAAAVLAEREASKGSDNAHA